MEESPFTGKSIPRTPPQKIQESLNSILGDENPIAARTRSKSVHSPNRGPLTEFSFNPNSPNDNFSLSPSNSEHSLRGPNTPLASVSGPEGLRELRVRLNRLKDFTDFNTKSSDFEHFVMANLSYTDLINAIPQFDGKEKDLESFITTCDTYSKYISEDQKGLFLAIVSTKLRGEALAKLQPISDFRSWAELKKALEEKLTKPVSFEFAQERLISVKQTAEENVEKYAERMRKALEHLNSASRSLTLDTEGLRMLRRANEKLAIRKFEQNMFNRDMKIMLGAAKSETLEDAIALAMDKELSFRSFSFKTCNFCKKPGHFERDCMSKKSKFSSNNFKRQESANNNEQGNQSVPQKRGFNSNDFRRNQASSSQNSNRNVRMVQNEEETEESLTLSSFFNEDSKSTNSKN